jgi:hypothetical protein
MTLRVGYGISIYIYNENNKRRYCNMWLQTEAKQQTHKETKIKENKENCVI